MTHYEGDFNLILGSDLAAGAFHVKVTDEGHFIDKEGQVIASLAPWPFELVYTGPMEVGSEAEPVEVALPEQERLFVKDEEEEVPHDEEGGTGG